MKRRLLIVSDAWHPQVNGVVRTLEQVAHGLRARGWQVEVLGPSGLTIPCPTYPEIRLSLEPRRKFAEMFNTFQPHAIHIATEGPLGWAARAFCRKRDLPFTTSFHTRFPEYLKLRYGIPRRWTYKVLRAFHRGASRVLVPTASICQELEAQGFANVTLWSRGVDTELYHPQRRQELPFETPVQLYVGRVAIEKNLEAFLKADTPGTKLIVGDGPARRHLQSQYPDAVFLGAKFGYDLAQIYASADVFVFPSLTDTFGLVMLEALASGVPVAAFAAPGPIDVIQCEKVGVLHRGEGLGQAITRALALNPADCRAYALGRSWTRTIEQFASCLVSAATFPDESQAYLGDVVHIDHKRAFSVRPYLPAADDRSQNSV